MIKRASKGMKGTRDSEIATGSVSGRISEMRVTRIHLAEDVS